jgi:hypothetical protein
LHRSQHSTRHYCHIKKSMCVARFVHASLSCCVMSCHVSQVTNRNRLQPIKIGVNCLLTTLPGGANLPGAGPASCARPLCRPPPPPAINSCGINSPAPSPARVASRPGSPVGRFGFV